MIALNTLPSPGFQGLACIIQDRPVIVLGYKHDEPGRLATFIAHETAHIAHGHCTADTLVVDQEEEVDDTATLEQQAELFATRVMVGADDIPKVTANNFRDLALKAAALEQSMGIDASAIIFEWARCNRDYATATIATEALYRSKGARQLIAAYSSRHIDGDSASDSDRTLLQCVLGGAAPDAPSH